MIRGCVPKKLLIYGAHFAEDLKDAKRFGWQVPDRCDFDWATLRDNVLFGLHLDGSFYAQAGPLPVPFAPPLPPVQSGHVSSIPPY